MSRTLAWCGFVICILRRGRYMQQACVCVVVNCMVDGDRGVYDCRCIFVCCVREWVIYVNNENIWWWYTVCSVYVECLSVYVSLVRKGQKINKSDSLAQRESCVKLCSLKTSFNGVICMVLWYFHFYDVYAWGRCVADRSGRFQLHV